MWCLRLKTSLQRPYYLEFMGSVLKGMGQESERGRGGGGGCYDICSQLPNSIPNFGFIIRVDKVIWPR